MPQQTGAGEPVPHGAFAAWLHRPVQGRDGEVVAGGETLVAFADVAVDELADLGPAALPPECFGEPPLEDFGVAGRGAGFGGTEDVVELAEVFLPDAATLAVAPFPAGIVVIGEAVNPFGFQPFHGGASCGTATAVGQLSGII